MPVRQIRWVFLRSLDSSVDHFSRALFLFQQDQFFSRTVDLEESWRFFSRQLHSLERFVATSWYQACEDQAAHPGVGQAVGARMEQAPGLWEDPPAAGPVDQGAEGHVAGCTRRDLDSGLRSAADSIEKALHGDTWHRNCRCCMRDAVDCRSCVRICCCWPWDLLCRAGRESMKWSDVVGARQGRNFFMVLMALLLYFSLVIMLAAILEQAATEGQEWEEGHNSIFTPLIRVFGIQFVKFSMEIILQLLFFEIMVDLRVGQMPAVDQKNLLELVEKVQMGIIPAR